MNKEKLLPKQRKFINEYMLDFNGTHAAIRAGYSKNAAQMQASRLLSYDMVKKEIEKRTLKASEKAQLKKEDILNGLQKDIEADPLELFNDRGELRDLKDIPKELRRSLIIEIEDVWDEVSGAVIGIKRKIRLRDAGKSRELYGKHLGMWVDKLEVKDTTSAAERLKRAIDRANAVNDDE